LEVARGSGGKVSFKIGRNGKSIGSVFSLMEELKERHLIAKYVASQTSLE